MSSTNRGAERSEGDYYSTPAWVVDALLRRVGSLTGKRILEPSAGTGGIVKRLLAAGAEPDLTRAVEPDPARHGALVALHPKLRTWRGTFEDMAGGTLRFDMIVTNPPFSLAQEHIELAVSLLAPGGLCCALERLAFGASRKRAAFRSRHSYDKLELACRPSFTNRRTDSADYAWFCFGTWPDGRRCGGRFEVIEEGPST